jgi:hypothetical protein
MIPDGERTVRQMTWVIGSLFVAFLVLVLAVGLVLDMEPEQIGRMLTITFFCSLLGLSVIAHWLAKNEKWSRRIDEVWWKIDENARWWLMERGLLKGPGSEVARQSYLIKKMVGKHPLNKAWLEKFLKDHEKGKKP